MSPIALVRRHPPAYLRLLRARGLRAREPRAERAPAEAAADEASCASALVLRCQALLAHDGIARFEAPSERRGDPDGVVLCPLHAPAEAGCVQRCCAGRWLLAHHPAHLLAVCIGCADAWLSDGAYVALARRRGLAVRGPCVHASTWATRAVGCELHLGLHLVDGLGRADAEAIIVERARARFSGMHQLKARCRLGADALRTLERAGALDQVAPHANATQRAWLVERAAAEPTAFIANASVGGERLLAELALETRDPPAPPLRAPDPAVTQARRWQALGCVMGSSERPRAAARAPRLRDLPDLAMGTTVALTVRSASRQASRCVALEDEDTLAASWWGPAQLERGAGLLRTGQPFLALGRIVAAGGGNALAIEHARAL